MTLELCDKNSVKSIIVEFVYEVIVEKVVPTLALKKLWDNI